MGESWTFSADISYTKSAKYPRPYYVVEVSLGGYLVAEYLIRSPGGPQEEKEVQEEAMRCFAMDLRTVISQDF